jgi:hypothetical protein
MELTNRISGRRRYSPHDHLRRTGSWLEVVIISKRLPEVFQASHAQPEPWIPSAAAVNSCWKFVKALCGLVRWRHRGLSKHSYFWIACESVGAASSFESGLLAGARFFQNREWLMCPPPLNLIADWRWIWSRVALADESPTSLLRLSDAYFSNKPTSTVIYHVTNRIISIDISLMVLFVMKSHDFLRDEGLERLVLVGKRRELNTHEIQSSRRNEEDVPQLLMRPCLSGWWFNGWWSERRRGLERILYLWSSIASSAEWALGPPISATYHVKGARMVSCDLSQIRQLDYNLPKASIHELVPHELHTQFEGTSHIRLLHI